MDYWSEIKQINFGQLNDYANLSGLVRQIENEIDDHQKRLQIIESHFQSREEPNFLGGALITHLLWHFNHSIMFYVSFGTANLALSCIHLRILFENLISLLFILSNPQKSEDLAWSFFENSKAKNNIRHQAWYKSLKDKNGKSLNLLNLCREIQQFTKSSFTYDSKEKYNAIYRHCSDFIHPSGAWTGQWWKYFEAERRHTLIYEVGTDHFEYVGKEAVSILKIINTIYNKYFPK